MELETETPYQGEKACSHHDRGVKEGAVGTRESPRADDLDTAAARRECPRERLKGKKQKTKQKENKKTGSWNVRV